ncbi:MAG: FAD-dependent oxidoreductase [Cellulophaga sp.]
MKKNIIIIGGGIIGLSTAYYLLKEGHTVTIIDKSDINNGASFVNAGYLTPSHIIPLAAPGMIKKGLKWMLNSRSPFYVKPRLDKDFLKWAYYFNRSSTKDNVTKAIPLLKDINVLSTDLFTSIHKSGELGNFQLEKKGLLMLFKTQKAGDSEITIAQKVASIGLDAKEISLQELNKLQPNLNKEIIGAIHYNCDSHTSPDQIMHQLKNYLKEQGVSFKLNEEVIDFKFKNSSITSVITKKETYATDEVVLASGSWSQNIAKKLDLKINIQAGKGYRINVKRPTGIVLPAILLEAKIAVTPMNGFTRFAGTMEFSGINHTISKNRVDAIANASMSYYDGLEITASEKSEVQCGLRPVSPDGLPYIGRTSKYKNLTIGTGHAMMGWSLGPATGKLITEIISNQKLSMNVDGFHPDRKF